MVILRINRNLTKGSTGAADSRAQVLTTSAEAAIQAPHTAADGCLSTPKGATPAGSHWYYRIDRVTKRQCWYLREESDAADKFTRATSPPSAPAPASAPASAAAADDPTPAQRTITRKTIADARAEWVRRGRSESRLWQATLDPLVSSGGRKV